MAARASGDHAVFVLHEVFGFEYDEIAGATERSADAVRQLASRARKHVQARRPRVADPPDTVEVARRFMAAATTGDVQQLLDVLAPDVVLVTDGGGRMKAALRPITGPDKVARFLDAILPPGAAIHTGGHRPTDGRRCCCTSTECSTALRR